MTFCCGCYCCCSIADLLCLMLLEIVCRLVISRVAETDMSNVEINAWKSVLEKYGLNEHVFDSRVGNNVENAPGATSLADSKAQSSPGQILPAPELNVSVSVLTSHLPPCCSLVLISRITSNRCFHYEYIIWRHKPPFPGCPMGDVRHAM